MLSHGTSGDGRGFQDGQSLKPGFLKKNGGETPTDECSK